MTEPQYRAFVSELISNLLVARGYANRGVPVISSTNKEGANRFGQNGFFDYVRQLPSAKLLILELKVQDEKNNFNAFDKTQHLLLCALSKCSLPIRYAWNARTPSSVEHDFLTGILLETSLCVVSSEMQPSALFHNKDAPSLSSLMDYIETLLDETSVQTWGEKHNQLLGLLGQGIYDTNAATLLMCLVVGENEHLLLDSEDLKEISKELKSLVLPSDWRTKSVDDLSSEITLLVGSYINKKTPQDDFSIDLEENHKNQGSTNSASSTFSP